MTEVEDVPFGGPATVEYLPRSPLDHRPRCKQDGRIQVALKRLAWLDSADGFVKRHTPVDANNVSARCTEDAEQFASVDAEVDARHAGGRERVEDPLAVGQHVRAIVVQAERAGPRIEQLDGAGASGDLHLKEFRSDPGEPAHEVSPQLRLPVHEGLGVLEILRRPAVDQVADRKSTRL